MDWVSYTDAINLNLFTSKLEADKVNNDSFEQNPIDLRLKNLSLVKKASDLVIIFDTEGRIVSYDVPKNFNLMANEVIGKTPFDFFDIETANEMVNCIKQVVKSGQPLEKEIAVKWKGKTLYFLSRICPIKDDSSHVIAVSKVSNDITNFKQVEGELKASESRYRTIIEDQTEYICRFLPGGIITFANSAISQYFGKSSDELIGQSFLQFLPEEDRAMVESKLSALSQPSPIIVIEHRVVKPNGEVCWQEWVNQAIFDEESRLIEFQASGRDITKRKKMEEALRQSEEKYRNIVETANEGIIIIDAESRITYVNDKFAEMLGYRPEELIGRSSIDFYDKGYIALALSKREQRRQYGAKDSFEFKLIRKDGSPLWVLVNTSPQMDKDGKYAGTLGMLTDINESKRLEQELKKSEEKSRLQIKYAPSMIYEVDFRGPKFVSVNDAMCSALGYTREELLAKNPLDLLEDESKKIFHDRIKRHLAGDKLSDSIEYTGKTKDGRIVYGLLNISFTYEDSKPVGAVVVAQDITERKRMEEALSKSERKYRSIIEQTKDGIMLIDETGCIAEWNAGAEKITGLDKAKVLGKPIWEVQSSLATEEVRTADLIKVLRKTAAEILTTGNSLLLNRPSEHAIKRPDGTKAVVEEVVCAIPTRQGFMICSTLRDVTERKHMEEELRRSKDELEQRVAERTDELVWMNQELESNIKELKKAEGLLELQHDLAVALSSARDLNEALSLIMDTALKVESIDGGAIYSVNDDGSVDLMIHRGLSDEFIQVCSHYDAGSARALIVVSGKEIYKDFDAICKQPFKDIPKEGLRSTAILPIKHKGRVTADINLASRTYDEIPFEARTTLEAIAASIGGVITRLKAEDALQESEKTLQVFLNAISEPALLIDMQLMVIACNIAMASSLGRNAEELLGKYALDFISPHIAETRKAWIDKVICNAKPVSFEDSNSGRHFINHISPILDESGKVSKVAIFAVDITERTQFEDELRKAKEVAEGSLRAKSEFLAVMSHELRTPLNAILGMAGLLAMENLSYEQRESIDIIKSSSESLLAAINDILNFTKNAVNLLSSKANAKGVDIACSIDRSVPGTIISDQMRLRQVLLNLLDNAIKFTDKGRIDVSVLGRSIENGRQEILFSIKDTGIGISQKDLSKLFQPFSQVDMSNTRKYGGTGLGLAISRGLVELLGGKIWVQSEIGGGSTFYFTIIADWLTDRPSDNSDPALRMNKPEKEPMRDCRVLLAEDNQMNQDVTLRMLKKLGYTADAVASGRGAIESLQHQHYDIILMDVQMPDTDGLEATRQIRTLWPDNSPKIIALTAHALVGDRERCIEAGMDDYISKPVAIDELAEVLGKYLPSKDSQ